jgi:hypothetical protein
MDGSMRQLFGFLPLAAALLATPCCAGTSPPPAVAKLGEQRLAWSAAGPGPRVDRPYFDGRGRLLLDDAVGGPAACPAGSTEVRRITRLLAPRVDEVGCSTGGSWLIGIDAEGKAAWRRALGFRSGVHTLDEVVLGAGPDGIVLSNLTVVAPRTGETLVPAPVGPVGPERRPVPDYDLAQSALYLPHRRAFVLFEADVTLVRRKGGLYLLHPAQGKKDLLLGVSTTPLGGYWRVEEMGLSADRRHLLLAQKLAVRGPGGVAFAVIDLATGRRVFEERFGEGHFCRDPQLVVGSGGQVGFAFLDETEGKRILVHYRVSR